MSHDLPFEWNFSTLESIELEKPSPIKVAICGNCKEEAAFAGWPDCLACGCAILRIEHPNYPTFARSLGYTEAQLEQLDREFARTEIKLGEVA